MIEAIYYRKKHKVTVKGHANSGELGHDLVCAGVTTVVYTLAANVTNLNDSAPKLYRRKKITLDKGNAEISLSPKKEASKITTLIFDALCAGFELLARNYPKNVSYKIL